MPGACFVLSETLGSSLPPVEPINSECLFNILTERDFVRHHPTRITVGLVCRAAKRQPSMVGVPFCLKRSVLTFIADLSRCACRF